MEMWNHMGVSRLLMKEMVRLLLSRTNKVVTWEEAELMINKHFKTGGNRSFVAGLYLIFLNHFPRNNEEKNWVRCLDDNTLTRGQVAMGFWDSDEFRRAKHTKYEVKIEEISDGNLI